MQRRAGTGSIAALMMALVAPAQDERRVDTSQPRLAARDTAVEEAVARGLLWLRGQQNDRGFWHGLVGTRSRNPYLPAASLDAQIAAGKGHLGVTALCGMAFLAGGHLPDRGEHGAAVQKATDAVLSCISENGVVTSSGTRMYSHAFATLFLAEVYGNESSKELKDGLERATNIIVDTQNAYGGWRYNAFSRDADLSVTVCQLQALRAARNIGIGIPKQTIDRAVNYVIEHQVLSGPHKGRYYYNIHGRRRNRKSDHYSIQAAAATSLLSAGIYEARLLDDVVDFLSEEMERVKDREPHHYHFWYGNYYASQVFYHADGLLREGCFRRYYDAMRAHLLADQRPDGNWHNPHEEGPGDAFATAVACIILQIPKQYLPIFQR